MRPNGRLALALTTAIVAALIVSVVQGAPTQLPGIALGSAVLLHAERAAAMFAIVVAVTSVLNEAAQGRLPTQLSTTGLAYAPQDANVSTVARLQVQFDRLERRVREVTELALGCQEPKD